ncbi:MAG: hypothetical protein JF616_12350 [Fibrobacteres bacterium]|nr:hypothetical protein [Fibrobacterota bacterium]
MRMNLLGHVLSAMAASFSLGRGQWQNTHLPFNGDVPALLSVGTELYAATGGGGVYRSSDNGDTWVRSDSGLTSEHVLCLAASGPDLFAGTLDGGVFFSSNQGASWNQRDSGMPGHTEINALAVSGDYIFAGAYGSGIFRSSDKGRNWTLVDTRISSQRAFLVTGTGLFVASPSGIYRSADEGLHWTVIDSGLGERYAESLAAVGSRLFAGTTDAAYISLDNGDDWTNKSEGLSLTYTAVPSLLAVGENLIAGTPIGVYRSGDYGNSWEGINSGFTTINYIESLAAIGGFLFASVSNSTLDNGVWRMTVPTTAISARSRSHAGKGSRAVLRTREGAYSVLGRRADPHP